MQSCGDSGGERVVRYATVCWIRGRCVVFLRRCSSEEAHQGVLERGAGHALPSGGPRRTTSKESCVTVWQWARSPEVTVEQRPSDYQASHYRWRSLNHVYFNHSCVHNTGFQNNNILNPPVAVFSDAGDNVVGGGAFADKVARTARKQFQ